MRIVIDLQGAQSHGSRNRGIGRYSTSMAQAIIQNKGEHEVIIILNGLFPDTIEPIRAAFEGLLPQEDIKVWNTPGSVCHLESSNNWHRKTAELLREAFIASLEPDILYITSLFEGLSDDAITSIGLLTKNIPTAVTLYDLIPLINRSPYLNNPVIESWYENKLDHLRRASLLLAISDSSRQEGVDYLDFPKKQVINVSTAADPQFRCIEISEIEKKKIRERYGLSKSFVMYTGGIDHRKNIEGLIRAFALLSQKLRKSYQLAIVCSVQPESRRQLEELAKQQGLAASEIILTGFVPEEDLISLYNLCTVFIFPSWHEGFGLPALEAMCCGRAVIGANTSSLPEVIGRDDALFDPHSDQSIAEKLSQVLSDEVFRKKLEQHGVQQAKKFSWDVSAKKAIAAFESWHETQKISSSPLLQISSYRPKLAYISPLPPERSGISDYSAELIVELARHYDIEVITNQDFISDPWIKSNCQARTVEWFKEKSNSYDRILYHFGNSHFHQHMFDLLAEISGVVVLHDFFVSGIAAHMDFTKYKSGNWTKELYLSHGYKAVEERFHAKELSDIIWRYPTNLCVLQNAHGVIVHSENSRRLGNQWYGNNTAKNWALIPHLRVPERGIHKDNARRLLNLKSTDFIVCSFGLLSLTKLNHRLLNAWLSSSLAKNKQCILVFVGENHNGEYGENLIKTISQSGTGERIRITGWADTAIFRNYLSAADLGVQLRTLSRGETSGTVLDCMNYGLPTIVNANGSMSDLPNDAVWKLVDDFDDVQLIDALENLYKDAKRRDALGKKAKEIINSQHSPRTCSDMYAASIEEIYKNTIGNIKNLSYALAQVEPIAADDNEWVTLAESVARSIPTKLRRPQLLIDISELVCRDGKTGIQRVVRSMLRQLLTSPPDGYRIEPIYASPNHGYRYARQFTLGFLDCPDTDLNDEFVEYFSGDMFVGLDFRPEVVLRQAAFYQDLRKFGVKVYFVVYDLLPIQQPHNFVQGASDWLQRWMQVISNCDGVVCISKEVAIYVNDWLMDNGPERLRSFSIGHFNLGADIAASIPTMGLPNKADTVLKLIKSTHSFLMVGTLEPRKKHDQVLAAFDKLWEQGIAVNLVLVGKPGWMIDALAERLRTHKKFNTQLFWLEDISDEYLEYLYAASTCLIAASEGEGYGLPLIEAAQHKLPIIARDIPIFREVAGDNAFYFSGDTSETLANCICEWLDFYARGTAPKSDAVPLITWEQSSNQFIDIILNNNWTTYWMPDGRYRFHLGADPRLLTQVGVRNGLYLQTNKIGGCLLHGPYLPFQSGRYQVRVHMQINDLGSPKSYIDIAARGGLEIMATKQLSCFPGENQIVEIDFFIKNSVTDLEIRVFVANDSDLKVSMLEILPEHLTD